MGKRYGDVDKSKNKVSLFLDSGAFSAWTRGVEINIWDYIEFIKQHVDVLEVYVNLDVIGDHREDKRIAAEKTFQNQKIMEDAGLSPLPVFHVGEPFEYLTYYVTKYDYIGLGGMVGVPKATLLPWLDECFEKYICDIRGIPRIKVHGFGMTSFWAMFRYPWFSVDSTSWVKTGRMGSIYVPRFKDGKWDYRKDPWKIAVSSQSPTAKEVGKHITSISPRQRQIVLDYIHAKGYTLGKSRFKEVDQSYKLKENEQWFGKKPKDKNAKRIVEVIEEPGLCNIYQFRDELNIIYFQDLERHMPEWPWPFKKEQKVQGFF